MSDYVLLCYVVVFDCVLKCFAEDNHVQMFLDHHGGAGVQHIALHSPDMLYTVNTLACRGVPFRRPPPAYYKQVLRQ